MADSRPEIVRRWLASLAQLVNAPGNPDRVAASVAVYIPLLLQAVPIEAFNAESLYAIARRARDYMPSYGVLADWLEGFWEEQRPNRPLRLKAPEPAIYRVEIPERRPPPDETEVAYVGALVAGWVRDVREAAEARAAAEPPQARAVQTGKPVTDSELLAAYARLGPAGAVRATALRRKLGIDVTTPTRPSADPDAWLDVLAARAADLASDDPEPEEDIPQ
jgi:hypothetical protein